MLSLTHLEAQIGVEIVDLHSDVQEGNMVSASASFAGKLKALFPAFYASLSPLELSMVSGQTKEHTEPVIPPTLSLGSVPGGG